MKRIVLPVVIIAGSIAVAVFLISNPTEIEETAAEIQPVSVRVVEATLGSTRLTVHSQGKVQAAQQVNLSAPVSGPVSWVSPALEPGGGEPEPSASSNAPCRHC